MCEETVQGGKYEQIRFENTVYRNFGRLSSLHGKLIGTDG